MQSTTFDLVRIRGLLRSVSHTETLAAADTVAGNDTARLIKFTPMVGDGAGSFVIVDRIQAQDIRPSNLSIIARDLNRHGLVLPLTPDLLVDDVLLIGDRGEGVELLVRNRAGRTVDLTSHISVVTEEGLAELLGGGGVR